MGPRNHEGRAVPGSITSMTSVEPPDFGLQIDGAKSRYSLAFLSAVCAQAGATMVETRQDEDVHAVDATVALGPSYVQVQLKCTWTPRESRNGMRIDLKPEWIEKWREKVIPTYIVGIVVPKSKLDWIEYSEKNVIHNTTAYWERFNPETTKSSIVLPHQNRLTPESLHQWNSDLASMFRGIK